MSNVRLKNDLVKKWSDKEKVKGSMNISSIEDKYIKENMAMLLDNQATYDFSGSLLTEAASTTGPSYANLDASTNADWKFRPIALALQRRTFPDLFANKVVGVQAMPGPVGLAFALRFTYDKTGKGDELAWDKVPQYGGFSGNPGTSAGLTSANGLGDTTGSGWSTSAGEALSIGNAYSGGTMNQIGLRFDQQSITATTRKLAASYTLESAQDIKVMQGIDVEREMINMLQYEILAELDRELIYNMKVSATDTSVVNGVSNGGLVIPSIDVTSSASFNQQWGGTGERFMNIVAAIIHQSNQIALTTRRGPGNFAIVSPAIATALQGAGHQFVQYTSKVDAATTSAPIGKLNGTIEVYRDQYATNDYALLGYKGPGISDAGIIFAPYLMGLKMSAVDPNNFYPTVGVMSRYSILRSLMGSGRYYRLLTFTNMGSVIAGASYGTGTMSGYTFA